MTQKNRTLEGKNRTLGGEGGSKIVKNCRTSFMYVPLHKSMPGADIIRNAGIIQGRVLYEEIR